MWKTNGASAGDTVILFLDRPSIRNGVEGDLYEGNINHDLMQHIEEGYEDPNPDTLLNTAPAYTKIHGDLDSWDYTFILYVD
jgi:hypothetical protein